MPPVPPTLRWPATLWSIALALGAAALSAWLLHYFLDERHYLLRAKGLVTLGAQAREAFASDVPLSIRVFLLGPWLGIAAAVASAVIAWRAAVGSRLALWLSTASLAALPVAYLVGASALRRLEDRIFYPRSPWVQTFETGCLALAVVAAAALGWAGATALRSGRRRVT